MSTQSTRAWVHAGIRQTAYLRAGSGRTVILLGGQAGAAALLFAELARSCRVIQPDPNPASEDLSQWLGGFLDALGAPSVALIACDGHALASLRFALAEPERIERLALVVPGRSRLDGQEAWSDVLAQRSQPLLVLAIDQPEPVQAQVDELLIFLSDCAGLEHDGSNRITD